MRKKEGLGRVTDREWLLLHEKNIAYFFRLAAKRDLTDAESNILLRALVQSSKLQSQITTLIMK